MKKLLYSFLLILFVANVQAQSLTDTLRHEVLLETDSGNIRIQLYNETPRHRDNFLKLVRSGAYNGVLFHRVIKDFMIQSGDMASKTAKPGQALGDTPETYSLPAEINYPKLLQERLKAQTDSTVQMTPEVRQIYKEVGGTPHLDGQYTVFGQVLEGLDVVERIQRQPVDANDRPLVDVRVRKATVLK